MIRKNLKTALCIGVVAAAAAACADDDSTIDAGVGPDVTGALASITAEEILEHTKALSSDEFEGRAPGTAGEELTVDYLTEQFKAMGLQPGNPDGTYIQNVPLMGYTSTPTMQVQANGQTVEFNFPEDYVAVSRRAQPEIDVQDSELVFVGYGVVAPEYGWDDYKGLDVEGKTLVMLINDPAVIDPSDPARLDSTMFNGEAMTYYGRWTYKYEIASELGADAVIIVHETEPAGYPYDVVVGSWGRENFDIQPADGNAGRVAVEGWMTLDKASELFAAAGHDFEELKAAARTAEFEPVPLGATADLHVSNEIRQIQSRNVVARLEGSENPDEHIVYSAHWDHLGRDSTLEGDQIYNGALDNASGTAGMLEIAEAFAALPTPPSRSILFLAVTAEEKGLLGAKYYAENPLYPLETTVANINIDGVNQWGRTRDIVVVGYGNSTLEDVLAEAAADEDRIIVPDPEPENGYFYRSDHFEFAKKGVPALYTDLGTEFIGKPAGYGDEKRDEYTTRDYHAVSDEVKPDWDLSGAAEDMRLLFLVGSRVSEAEMYPEWYEGTEFKATREVMLSGETS